MAVREILQIDDPRLFARNALFSPEDIVSDETAQMIGDAFDTLQDSGGYGLALPQMGINRLGFVIGVPGGNPFGHEEIEPYAVFNPQIIVGDDEAKVPGPESCLSFANNQIVASVLRRAEIVVVYKNIQAVRVRETLRLWHARVFQHEYDHLAGRLFVDGEVEPHSWTTRSAFRAQRLGSAARGVAQQG